MIRELQLLQKMDATKKQWDKIDEDVKKLKELDREGVIKEILIPSTDLSGITLDNLFTYVLVVDRFPNDALYESVQSLLGTFVEWNCPPFPPGSGIILMRRNTA